MKPIPQAKQSSYRPEIDGIRAFAVTAVIINHFNKEILPSGYLGVDIFFVISGFVITSSLASRPSKNFRDFLAGFYTRRIKRLVPVLVLFVLVTSILICLFNPTPDASLKTGIASLFGLSNLYLLRQSTDYFAASTELNVFTHMESGLEALSGQLSARGIQLAILHGLPFAREAHCQPVIAAKQWFHLFGGPCQLPSRRESLLRRDNLNKVLVSLEAEGKLHIVDIFDVFCPEEQCTYNTRNGQILYRDEFSHPSVEAARLSSPIIRKVLTSS